MTMNVKYYFSILLIMAFLKIFGQNKTPKNRFDFIEPENTSCFVCNHVFNHERDILYASHDVEGDWQFLCGQEDHTEENAKIISLKNAAEIDQSINDLYEMPKGIGAERKTKKEKWKPFKL
jgi:hypothetical protein